MNESFLKPGGTPHKFRHLLTIPQTLPFYNPVCSPFTHGCLLIESASPYLEFVKQFKA